MNINYGRNPGPIPSEEQIAVEMKMHKLSYRDAFILLQNARKADKNKSVETFQRLEAEGQDFRRLALTYKSK